MAEVTSSGLDKLKAKLLAIPQAVRDALHGELEEEGDELVAAMKRLVRKDSGRTEDSIHKEDGSHELQVLVKAGGKLTTKPVRKGASAEYDYALGEEYGNKHSPAHPFFWPAYRAKRKDFRRRRLRVARAAIKDVVES